MEKQYDLTKQFQVRYTDVDSYDKMKLSAYLSLALEAACDSADLLGFGYDDIMPQNIGFFISNFHIELERPVTLREDIAIETWPLPPGKVLFFRDFLIKKGEAVLARATSRWCLFHFGQEKIVPSAILFGQDYERYRKDRSLSDVSWKIPCASREGEPRLVYPVGISDLDHYHHVNNTKYADFIQSTYTEEEWNQKELKSFSITFLRQCRAGEFLSFYRERIDETTELVSGYVGEECAVSAKLVRRER